MPTIEIISVNAKEIPNLRDYKSFTFICENKLESHRALFNDELKENYEGVIVHLGNKSFQKDKDKDEIGVWFASDLINFESDEEIKLPIIDKENQIDGDKQWWGSDQSFLFKFKQSIIDDLKDIINQMIKLSPINEVLFLTDYQFGPEKPSHKGQISLEDFFYDHDKVGLIWNCMYHIKN